MDLSLDSSRSAAYREWLTATFLRGLAHELANVVQMLALEPPASGTLATSRERLTTAIEVLAALGETPDSAAGPSLLPDVLREVAAWQGLQTGLPTARLEIAPMALLPALASEHALVRDVLLALLSAAKSGGATTITVSAAQEGARVRCKVQHNGARSPSAQAQAYVRASGADLQLDAPDHWELSFGIAGGSTGSP